MRELAAAVAVALLALTTACDPDDVPVPNETRVDVDTPALRAAKAKAGVDDCVAQSGGPVDGGLPAVTLPCFGGGPAVDVAALRGPLVVNLWASWCPPCRKELPILAKFHAEHGDEVAMLGIDYQDVQTDKAMAMVHDSGVTYPQLADPGGDLSGNQPFGPIRGMPVSVFVRDDGTATVVPVVIESQRQLLDLVAQHLGIKL